MTRQRFAVLGGKAMFGLTTLIELLKDPDYKTAFLKMKGLPFIPEKGGSAFDSLSCFGVFMRPSILGQNSSGYVYQESLANETFE